MTLASVREARRQDGLRAVLAQEYGLVSWFAQTRPDLVEGIRAQLVDKDRNPRYFNSVCLVSPGGKIVAHYRKLTPWPYPEQSWATPGDLGVATYDTEYGRVGLAICYDIHTILEKYQPKKIWALLYPIAWVDD